MYEGCDVIVLVLHRMARCALIGRCAMSYPLLMSWEVAVSIIVRVLENPDAAEDSKVQAREELLKLARAVDAHQKAEEVGE